MGEVVRHEGKTDAYFSSVRGIRADCGCLLTIVETYSKPIPHISVRRPTQTSGYLENPR